MVEGEGHCEERSKGRGGGGGGESEGRKLIIGGKRRKR